MNYHFTTTKTHIQLNGGRVEEVFKDEALNVYSNEPFKGNIDLNKLESLIKEVGVEHVPFVRIELGTNLIGGQPVSLQNVQEVSQVRFIADRIAWLYENRNLIGGLKFVEEPAVMRFFIGRLEPIGDWQEKLVAKFKEDFQDSL